MSGWGMTSKLDLSGLDKVARRVRPMMNQTLDLIAEAAQEGARAELHPGHGFDFGTLQASIYIVSPHHDDYDWRVANAATSEADPSFGRFGPLAKCNRLPGEAVISFAATYGYLVHTGLGNNLAGPIPFLVDGVRFVSEILRSSLLAVRL